MARTGQVTESTGSPPQRRPTGGGAAAAARAVLPTPFGRRARLELLFCLAGIPLGLCLLLVPYVISGPALAKMNRNYLAGPVVYGTATIIAFGLPYVSLGIFAALAVYWLLPGTGPRAGTLSGGQGRVPSPGV